MEKYAPWKLKKGNREYILEKVYPNYALYSDLEYGYKECFSFHDLGLIEETEKKGNRIKPENVVL